MIVKGGLQDAALRDPEERAGQVRGLSDPAPGRLCAVRSRRTVEMLERIKSYRTYQRRARRSLWAGERPSSWLRGHGVATLLQTMPTGGGRWSGFSCRPTFWGVPVGTVVISMCRGDRRDHLCFRKAAFERMSRERRRSGIVCSR